MADSSKNDRARNKRGASDNAFDTSVGYSGQEYNITRERAEGAKLPSGTVDPKAKGMADERTEREIPPDNGRRASFDPKTGEVHGSGAADGADEWRDGFSKDS